MKKIIFVFILIVSYSCYTHAQDMEPQEVISTNDTWDKEFFTFPLSFAGDIKYKGMEDARFPEGWGDVDSPEFWSYAFAWNISADTALTTLDMETNLQRYYNGLLSIDSTNAIFIQGADLGPNTSYTGKINTTDTRFTKKPMTLYVKVEQHYCTPLNRAFILFKLSPKGFTDNVWKKLQGVTLRAGLCEK